MPPKLLPSSNGRRPVPGKCAKCHTVGRGDRVGPDLKGLSERREKAWVIGFITKTASYLDNDPSHKAPGQVQRRAHGIHGHERGPAEGLLSYINAASKGPVGPEEEAEPEAEDPASKVRLPVEGRGAWLPGIAITLLLLALAPSSGRSDSPSPRGPARLGRRCRLLEPGRTALSPSARDQQGFAPCSRSPTRTRRTPASSRLTAVLHYGASRSDVAGVPPVSVCMNCHNAGAQGRGRDRALGGDRAARRRLGDPPEQRAQGIEWSRIHDFRLRPFFPPRARGNDIAARNATDRSRTWLACGRPPRSRWAGASIATASKNPSRRRIGNAPGGRSTARPATGKDQYHE